MKFCLQAHFFKIFGHAKFQLSIPCTHRAKKLFVENRELKFCMSKHLQKMYLETKFQPFLLIINRDIGWATWRSMIHLTFHRLYTSTDNNTAFQTPYQNNMQASMASFKGCHSIESTRYEGVLKRRDTSFDQLTENRRS